MNEIPAKVYAVVGLETGLFLGIGVALFYTVKVMYIATKRKAWTGFKEL